MYRRKPQGWLKHIDFILWDLLCLQVAFVLAYVTRHGWVNPYKIHHYMNLISVYTLVVVLLHMVNNTFEGVLRRGYYKELARTVRHIFFAELAITFYMFSVKESETYSRTVIYLLAAYYGVLSYGVRLVWKRVVRMKGYFFKSAVLYIITTHDRAEGVIKNIRTKAKGEYDIQGLCVLDQDCVGTAVLDVPVSSNRNTVLDFLRDKWVDEVYVSVPMHQEYPEEVIDGLAEMGIVVHVELEKVGSESWQIRQIQNVADRTVQTISASNISTRQAIVKRAMDIAGGIVGCLLTAVLTVIIGPMIYIQSPGPIFFAQTRVGRNGKKFKMYKFRSMYLDAEARKAELMKENRVGSGLMFKLDFDPRIIGCKKLPDGTIKKGVGNYIRDWSLDEFPQFWNVLKGDLSLCGTRPPTVDEWEKYKLHHRARLSIKPGITGMWQVSGRSDITDFEEVVELDKKYIREWSIGLDLRIILKTVLVVLGKKGAM